MSGGLRRLSPEGRIRADMMLLVTHIPAHAFASIHTLLCKTTAAKAWEGGGGGKSPVQSIFWRSPEPHIVTFETKVMYV